jgi:hypothetical protein
MQTKPSSVAMPNAVKLFIGLLSFITRDAAVERSHAGPLTSGT